MITYLVGDATVPATRPAVIAHVVNNIGAWGSGFTRAVSRRWPDVESVYRGWHRAGDNFGLGYSQATQVEDGLWVVNMVAQHGLRRAGGPAPIRYRALWTCLGFAATLARGHASLHMPRIGCGLAGGTWERVEPLVREACAGIDVYVYDPPEVPRA